MHIKSFPALLKAVGTFSPEQLHSLTVELGIACHAQQVKAQDDALAFAAWRLATVKLREAASAMQMRTLG